MGRWRLDVPLLWPGPPGMHRFGIERKILRGGLEDTGDKGLPQTASCTDRCGADAGQLLVFDRSAKPWDGHSVPAKRGVRRRSRRSVEHAKPVAPAGDHRRAAASLGVATGPAGAQGAKATMISAAARSAVSTRMTHVPRATWSDPSVPPSARRATCPRMRLRQCARGIGPLTAWPALRCAAAWDCAGLGAFRAGEPFSSRSPNGGWPTPATRPPGRAGSASRRGSRGGWDRPRPALAASRRPYA